MTCPARSLFALFFGLVGIVGIAVCVHDARSVASEPETLSDLPSTERPPATVQELRMRARLLHESLHATLQVVHHQY